MPKLQLPEGWFTVPITSPQQPVVEWLLNHLPEGEEAVKKGLCPMSGSPVPEGVKVVHYGSGAYAQCPECGENVTIQHYKFRAHKTPETLRAELLAKGFCEMSYMPVPPDAARGKYSDERTCSVCGRSVGMTSSGKFRQHKGKRK